MVTLAREARGLTQTALSKATGISQSYLSKIEAGLSEPTDEMLEDLSSALRYPREFFLSSEQVFGPGVSEFYHRKRQSVSVKLIRRAHARINIFLIHLRRLLRSVEIDENMPLFDLELMGPEEIARAVRATWSIPNGPIRDLTQLVEDAGGIVVLFDFGTPKIDGICRSVPGLPPVFFISKEIPADRYRLSLAHELGHVVMHREPNPDMETQANRFAAALLMPSQDIRPHLDSRLDLRRLAALKPHWRTSMAALLKRAGDLGKITERRSRYLWMQMGKAGYRRREPAELDFPREEPRLLRELVGCHLDDFEYTTQDLAQLLILFEEELVEQYALYAETANRQQLRLVQ